MLTVGSLFSGIGGLDLGLERAGMRVLWQCESDPYCRAVLRKHWPDIPCWETVQALVADATRQRDDKPASLGGGPERPDLLCGGFPCQPVSLAGKRRGSADDRWLWPEFARLIRVLRPRYALMENVPGLLVGGGLAEVLGDLADCGYDAEWDCVPAAAVGAPHLRYRVFIVAYASSPPGGRRSHEGRSIQAGLVDQQEPVSGDGSSSLADRSGLGRGKRSRIFRRLGAARRRGWLAEPNVGRVAYGVPSRVDRLRALGNAVVPQVAEAVGRMIAEHAA